MILKNVDYTMCVLSQVEQSKIFETLGWFLAFSRGKKPQHFHETNITVLFTSPPKPMGNKS